MVNHKLLPVLRSRGHTSFDSWAVVGNGPLHLKDRLNIALADVVVRFNDANNRWSGERTDLHVVRHPSWYTFSQINAPVLDVAPMDSLMPRNASMKLYVYESQHASLNKLDSTTRIFEQCNCGDSCLENRTWAGPSTGAALVSELQSIQAIHTIDVYGFNGMGDETAHIDFSNKTIIGNCCTKCTLHRTASDSYGNEAAVTTYTVLISILVLCAMFMALCIRRVTRTVFQSPDRRPLLTLPLEDEKTNL